MLVRSAVAWVATRDDDGQEALHRIATALEGDAHTDLPAGLPVTALALDPDGDGLWVLRGPRLELRAAATLALRREIDLATLQLPDALTPTAQHVPRDLVALPREGHPRVYLLFSAGAEASDSLLAVVE